jgi:Zn-dependent metalloprotease
MKRNCKNILIVLFLFCFIANINPGTETQSESMFKTAEITFDPKSKSPIEIRLAKDNIISVASFFEEYKSHYQISEENIFKPVEVFTDQLRQTHYRCRQYYKGIELADSEYLLHEKNGSVYYAHGQLIHNLNIDIFPAITESQALEIAMEQINAKSYMWESKRNEDFIKDLMEDSNASFYPKGDLLISANSKDQKAKKYGLVYRFDIFSENPFGRYDVDIDAKTGEIRGVLPRLYFEDVSGQGLSEYDGVVPITVSYADQRYFQGGWHLTNWNAFFGTGTSWWMADPALGNDGGYENRVYVVLDTDLITLTGNNLILSFFHRLRTAWQDGCNVRISRDGGESWEVLLEPSRSYEFMEGLTCFKSFGEGPDIPGWHGDVTWWSYVWFDLSPYKGENVRFRFAFASDFFRCTADLYPDYFGWQIDEIVVSNSNGILFKNSGQVSGMTTSAKHNKDTVSTGKYRLRESGRGNGIITLDTRHQADFGLAIDYFDDDSSFSDAPAGVSVHWGAEKTYDYFVKKHGRYSYDNSGGKIVSFVDWNLSDSSGFHAAYSGNGMMKFCDDENRGPFVSLGYIGHEFTHGVIQHSADLEYRYEIMFLIPKPGYSRTPIKASIGQMDRMSGIGYIQTMACQISGSISSPMEDQVQMITDILILLKG